MNRGYLFALLTVAFWTPVAIFIRALTPSVSAEGMMFWRFFFALLALGAAGIYLKKVDFKVDLRLLKFAGLGLLYAAVLYTYILAVQYTKIANAQWLQQMYPVYTFILAGLLLREKVKKVLYGSLLLAGVGASIIIFFQKGMPDFSIPIAGDLIALFSGLCLASYTVLSRYVTRTHPPFEATVWAFLFSTLAMAFIPISHGAAFAAEVWVLLLLFGVVSTALPFLTYIKATQFIPAQHTSLLGILTGITVPLAGAAFLGELSNPGAILGGALILAASVLVIAKG